MWNFFTGQFKEPFMSILRQYALPTILWKSDVLLSPNYIKENGIQKKNDLSWRIITSDFFNVFISIDFCFKFSLPSNLKCRDYNYVFILHYIILLVSWRSTTMYPNRRLEPWVWITDCIILDNLLNFHGLSCFNFKWREYAKAQRVLKFAISRTTHWNIYYSWLYPKSINQVLISLKELES